MLPLPTTLPDFSEKSILVVGDVMLDRYWFGETSRISPEAPVPIIKINHADDRPGGAANVALNIASLGAKVILLGITGKDEAANTLQKHLGEAGVRHEFCQLDSISTIIKLRVISRNQQLIRMDFEENVVDAKKDILIQLYKKYLTDVHLVILSDYKKGTLSDPQSFIQLARELHIPILIDPKGNDFNIYRNATIITPNFKEFETIAGPCANEEELIRKGKALLEQYEVDALLVTQGENGMTLIQQNDTHHLPAYAREVFDVTGAGDTVIGALGAAFAAKMDLFPATVLANLAASVAVGKLGAASVSKHELQMAINEKINGAKGIYSEPELLQFVKDARLKNKKIIFTNGCFDILHAGHVSYLQKAKQLGDYLIVAVNTDESIRKLKGDHRPVNTLLHRMIVLASLGMVDAVIPFADETPERLLHLIQPHCLVKGGDYQMDEVVGAEIVKAYGGEVFVISKEHHTSSTAIIQSINTISNFNKENVTHE